MGEERSRGEARERWGGAEGVLEVDDKKKIVKRLYVSAFCGWDFSK